MVQLEGGRVVSVALDHVAEMVGRSFVVACSVTIFENFAVF